MLLRRNSFTRKIKRAANRRPLVHFSSLFPIHFRHSYLSDSTGCRLAAWFAGRYPKKSPVEHDTTKAITTLRLDTGTRKFPGKKNCAPTGMAMPIKIPTTAPPPLITKDSIKN
jgi:hypothetical protein